MDFFDGHELGDVSDYDEETLQNANQAFFLCEEEHRFEEAEPFLKIAADRGHSYSMTQYALYLLGKRDLRPRDRLYACELLLLAAIRGEECSREYFKSLDKTVVDEIVMALKSMREESMLRWIGGRRITDANDKRQIQAAKSFICDSIKHNK